MDIALCDFVCATCRASCSSSRHFVESCLEDLHRFSHSPWPQLTCPTRRAHFDVERLAESRKIGARALRVAALNSDRRSSRKSLRCFDSRLLHVCASGDACLFARLCRAIDLLSRCSSLSLVWVRSDVFHICLSWRWMCLCAGWLIAGLCLAARALRRGRSSRDLE